jgi:nitrous oxide reductase
MKKKTFGIDRRDFLKTAAVGASAAAFPVGDAVAAGGGEAGKKESSASGSPVRGKPIRGTVKMY